MREVAAALAADEIGAALVDGAHGPVGIASERDIVTALGTGADPDALQARDLMNTDLITAGPDEPVLGIVDLMLAAGIRHVPVIADGRPVGMVSSRDVVVAARAVENPGPPTDRDPAGQGVAGVARGCAPSATATRHCCARTRWRA